ncbi:MAG: hypothetical protein ACI9ON_001346 [Limisphaerales bacterium]|jgi:hypothetical protein
MAEILGVGITHYPPLLGAPDTYANLLRLVLNSHLIPPEMKQPSAWPEAMQAQMADEQNAAVEHQQRHQAAFAKVRQAIDEFEPDAIIVFGDDQYENFKEDIIPPFNMYCMDEFPTEPFGFLKGAANIWDAPADHSFSIPGAGKLGIEIANAVINAHYPLAYSYKYLNHPSLTHAFANAIVYLDWQQKGWTYPIIPISVNCYGAGVVHTRGAMAQLFDQRSDDEKDPYLDSPGPAGPTPKSCFDLGETLREVLDARPERFVVMASSGWSHAFLTAKNHWLWPDQDFDQERYLELKQGRQDQWQHLTTESIEDAGSQEFKNWICLAGVVPERTPEIVDYLDTWIFNSQKCFALFHPS